MKNSNKSQNLENQTETTGKVKTLEMHLTIAGDDLVTEVKKAFDLAKSAGLELNVSFCGGTC